MTALQGCLDIEQRAIQDLCLFNKKSKFVRTDYIFDKCREYAIDYLPHRIDWLLAGDYGQEWQYAFYFLVWRGGNPVPNYRQWIFKTMLWVDNDDRDDPDVADQPPSAPLGVLSEEACLDLWASLSSKQQEIINQAIDEVIKEEPVPSGIYKLYKQRFGVSHPDYE